MARAAPRQPGPPAGVIFGCNRSSEEESLNGLFGMSSGHWSLVKEVIPGTPCFLFNFNTKELHGVFRAVSGGSWNIDPLAYGGKPKEGSMYPAQVRVEYCPRCPPMEEQYFKPAISANYFNPNRFRWELSERQVEQLLDLFLGVGAPWPPEGRQQRAEPAREAPAYVEDTAARPYTIEPEPRARLEAHRDRESTYATRSRYASRSPVRDAYRRHGEEDRPRRAPELQLPRNLQPPQRQDEYRRSPSPHDRYRGRSSALPEELRSLPAHTQALELPRPLAMHDPYRADLRLSMPAVTHPFASLYGDTMSLHHGVGMAVRDPSLVLSPNAAPMRSPPRQHLLLEAPAHRQHSEPEPAPAAAYDLSSMGFVGDVFTGLSSDTAILDRQSASLPALPADLSLSDRFQQLPETRERRHAAQISPEPLHISSTAGAGRVVSFAQPQPAAVPQTSRAPTPTPPAVPSADPTTVVISSIPHSCTTTMLVSILDQNHRDQYDFVHYQPSEEFDSTAVVNFTRAQHAQRFQDEMQDASWSDLHTFDPPTSAIASVAPHSIQGKDALLAHHGKAATRFGGAPGNESRLPSNRPLFFFCARKRPASAEHEQAPAPVRPRIPSSHPAMQFPPALQPASRADYPPEARAHSAALKMEQDSIPAFAPDTALPLSPGNRLSRPASPSNLSDHDRAHVRSRPGSAAATSSRPPPGAQLEPLKITIKQEPGMAQPITPSPDSALDGVGHTLTMLENVRGVSSSPRAADQPGSQQEAAAFLHTLGPELQQLQHRGKSPSRHSRSPSRHSHRHHSSRQHGKSSRPTHAEKDKHSSRRTSHTESRSSRGVQKVSSRDAKPPRDRSHRDSQHRSRPADGKPSSRSRHLAADQPLPVAAAPKTVHVSVNAAPFHDQLSNGAVEHAQSAQHQAPTSSHPYEEAVADNSPTADSVPGLQHSEQPVPAVPASAENEQQQPLKHDDLRLPVNLRPAEFGGDFLSLPPGSP